MKLRVSLGITAAYLLGLWLLNAASAATAAAADGWMQQLCEPLQKEKFFNPERVTLTPSAGGAKPLLEPQLSVSHEAREADVGVGGRQTTHRVHGEAGGKLNIGGDVSLTTVARIPIYTHETTGSMKGTDGVSSSELLKNTGRFSWRSELGVPLQEGVNLNFFYDNTTFGRIDKPGIDEKEEKFGTRFIFKFK